MKSKLVGRLGILVLGISGALSLGAFAQTTDEGAGPSEQPSAPMEVGQAQPPDSGDAGDPNAQPTEAEPGGPSGEAPAQTDQGVARISLIHGDVSTQRGDSGDWSAATLNQPLMTGDKVSTADNARAEVQLDFANTLRLGHNAKANVANLTHKNIQIQIGEGIANYSVSKDSEAEPEIDTPNVSIHPSHHDDVLRVEVHPDGDTIVIVRQGEAQISTPQGSTEIRAGEMATVRGDANSAEYKIASAPDRDDWDRWNGDRDHIIRDANSWRHTNRRYTGTQDLDAYGHWRNVPDYGDVWYPDEPSDWVPYRDGNWVWQPYYGWTWVGYEPWGWAPYHYGRWMWSGAAWGWWPGPVYAGYNPLWAPAYVSFWGWGGGFGFRVGWGGWGGFGWLPLGPCDWFHPWWGGYRGRFGVVNITNVHITNINNRRWGGIGPLHGGTRFSNINSIHNNHVFRAMSTVNAAHFGAGRMRPMAATREQLSGARMMAGNLPVVPSRASLSASGRAAAPSTVRNGGSQRFFGTHNNTARPVSFQQQTANLRQTMQQSHVAAIPAGGRNAGQFAAHNGSPMQQRPSAGIPANREANTFGNRTGSSRPSVPAANTRGGFGPPTAAANANRPETMPHGTTAQPVDRGGFRSSNLPGGAAHSAEQGNRPFSPSQPPRATSQVAPTENRGGFRSFTPPANNTRASEVGSMGRSGGTNQAAPPQNHGGFRPFTPPTSNTRPAEMGGMGSRGGGQSAPVENRGGFRPFSPPSNSGASRGAYSAPASRGNTGGYWNRTAPSSVGQQPRNYGSSAGSYGGGSSRPQLDMRQPIVRGPGYGGGNAPRGGYNSSPYGGGPRSTPSYGGGSHSAPSYGGGSHSAPSGGGRSSPSYGGGGHAPSGGGRSFGGGGGGGGHTGGGGGHSSNSGGGHSGHR
jgi:hypothetical protein